MKMKGAKQVHYDSGPNMTPLVDVVMVILIFLMLAGSFAGTTRFLVSKQGIHKQGVGGAHPDPNKPIETPIEIRINRPPTLGGDDNGFVAEGTGIKPTSSPDAIREALRVKREQFNAAGTPTDQLQVVLYPGRHVKYQDLIQIYQAALQANYTKVAFATSH
ncbi:MAG TPA: biopolymer transporter ExbD [Tepidisphaeraceae bacterium]|jgi:biopolymer transport protein ExbD|nr:biopolymer transporter ExbD [Tepidisphaeraceae bacterium]